MYDIFLSNVLNTELGQHTWETDFKFIFYLLSRLFDLQLVIIKIDNNHCSKNKHTCEFVVEIGDFYTNQ